MQTARYSHPIVDPLRSFNFHSAQTVIRQTPNGHATLAALLPDVTLKGLLRPPLSEPARTRYVESVTHETREYPKAKPI